MNTKLSCFLILLSLTIAILLYSGCSEETENLLDVIGNDDNTQSGSGFGSMKAGSWAEYESEGIKNRIEFLGTDTYKGSECYILETENPGQTIQRIFQLWIDKKSNESVLFVMKEGNTVIKMDIIMSSGYVPKDAGVIPSTAKKLGNKDYTTPTGKKVKAFAYEIQTSYGTSEKWISDEVPFYAVKIISVDGKVTLSLYDFGSSGAKRDISKEEVENAKPFGQPL